MPQGSALGPERTTWANLCDLVSGFRRHGPKDGPGFCAARFRLEEGGRHVRRIKSNLLARTAIAMDIEASKGTGELPPTLDEMAKRIEARGWAAALWTSHNHKPPNDIRYRIVLPLSEEIDHELPAPDVIAAVLGVAGVLDKSKLGAASYFYLPSCSGDDTADVHQEIIVPGALIDAQWLTDRATALQEAREAERERQAAEAASSAFVIQIPPVGLRSFPLTVSVGFRPRPESMCPFGCILRTALPIEPRAAQRLLPLDAGRRVSFGEPVAAGRRSPSPPGLHPIVYAMGQGRMANGRAAKAQLNHKAGQARTPCWEGGLVMFGWR